MLPQGLCACCSSAQNALLVHACKSLSLPQVLTQVSAFPFPSCCVSCPCFLILGYTVHFTYLSLFCLSGLHPHQQGLSLCLVCCYVLHTGAALYVFAEWLGGRHPASCLGQVRCAINRTAVAAFPAGPLGDCESCGWGSEVGSCLQLEARFLSPGSGKVAQGKLGESLTSPKSTRHLFPPGQVL